MMPNPPHTFCSHCGERHEEVSFPRTCTHTNLCGAVTYLNPTPVVVCVVPIASEAVVIGSQPVNGVLVERRGIMPDKGKLAMPSGFIDMDLGRPSETWQEAACRELTEETNMIFRPEQVEHMETISVPRSVLIFAKFPHVSRAAVAALNFEPNEEVLELLIIDDPSVLVWETHQRMAARVMGV